MLFIIGHMYRYGADILEVMPGEPGASCLTAEQCSDIIMDFFENPAGISPRIIFFAERCLTCVPAQGMI